jgi:Mg/Co/Ni transporter MgtE
MMTTHMLVVKESDTIASALKLLVDNRERDISDGVVVVDLKGRLVDHIQTIELVAGKASSEVATLVGPPYPTAVRIDTPLDEVVEEFINNRGSSIIVTDEKSKPVGRILADDLVDSLTSTENRGFAQGGSL